MVLAHGFDSRSFPTSCSFSLSSVLAQTAFSHRRLSEWPLKVLFKDFLMEYALSHHCQRASFFWTYHLPPLHKKEKKKKHGINRREKGSLQFTDVPEPCTMSQHMRRHWLHSYWLMGCTSGCTLMLGHSSSAGASPAACSQTWPCCFSNTVSTVALYTANVFCFQRQELK